VSRGGSNLAYCRGFEIEADGSKRYAEMIKKALTAEQLEFTARSLADKAAGIDAVAQIEGLVYGVSLRYRSSDYNSFTLNRHISDPASEVRKWLRPANGNLKPAYHLQIGAAQEYYRVIRVNVAAFSNFLRLESLEKYYNSRLLAYEFKLEALPPLAAVRSFKINKNK